MIVVVVQRQFLSFEAGIQRGLIQLPLQKLSFFLYFSLSFKAPGLGEDLNFPTSDCYVSIRSPKMLYSLEDGVWADILAG